VIFKEKI